jgi:phage terminase large subunit-like protein
VNNNESTVANFVNGVIKSPETRVELVRHSHLFFFYTYFSESVTYQIAQFQRDWFLLTQNESMPLTAVVAFRGSGKSTIFTLSYVLWAILGSQQKKFVLIISQTQEQAQLHFKALKKQLTENTLLQTDLGPFKEDEWNANSLIIPKYNARITVASTETAIRGMKHGFHRPDLIICDDIEDSNSVKTREGRDKTYNWFTSEVVPLGNKNTKIIMVGNLLHDDSLMMRIKDEIGKGERSGILKEYPLIDENGVCIWPGKYSDAEEIEDEKKKVGNEIAWQKEYLLKIIADDTQVVFKEWIHYYDILPDSRIHKYRHALTGIDLAISQREGADFTAMISAKLYGWGDNLKIYILPDPLNKRLLFPDILKEAKHIADTVDDSYIKSPLLIESNQFQAAVAQQLNSEGYTAIEVRVSRDKRERLAVTSDYIKNGKILFPRAGTQELVKQMINLGVEKHDDLCDAFSLLVGYIIENERKAVHLPAPDPFREKLLTAELMGKMF